jgi:hypothetical protein
LTEWMMAVLSGPSYGLIMAGYGRPAGGLRMRDK